MMPFPETRKPGKSGAAGVQGNPVLESTLRFIRCPGGVHEQGREGASSRTSFPLPLPIHPSVFPSGSVLRELMAVFCTDILFFFSFLNTCLI